MQLSKLYANCDQIFAPIQLNCRGQGDVFNVIYGDVTDTVDEKRDSHNLGKTTLIHLLDFMFLKEVSGTSHFLETHKSRFEKFSFFMEVALNSGDFVTVRRAVAESDGIALLRHEDRLQNFAASPPDKWDHYGLALSAARELLDGIFDLRTIKPYDYRKALSYFLRTQEDYNDVLQVKKFALGQHVYWKPFVMTLLGLDEHAVKRKYELDKIVEKKEEDRKKREAELQIEGTDHLRLSAEIKILRARLQETEDQIDRFEFSDEERRMMHELVDKIEARVAEINQRLYAVRTDIRHINESLADKLDFKLADVEEIFRETKLHFPNQLKKSYEELVAFNRQITNERNRSLRGRKHELEEEQVALRDQRFVEEQKRKEYRSILQGSETLDKFKALQRNLGDQKAELTYREGQLERLQKLSELEAEISSLKRERSAVVDDIHAVVEKDSLVRESVASNFSNYCKRVLDHEGLFYVSQNSSGNVEFKVELTERSSSRVSRQSEGKSYKQLLCALFDLSLLKTYQDAPFFHFVYHDGILESLDHRKKRAFLDLAKEVIASGKTQYILSVIDSDLPRDENDERIEFEESEIILRLDDSGDGGRLFKMPEF